jgi:maltooligosyltrehalose trehalohydrolase
VVRFRLWAPEQSAVAVVIETPDLKAELAMVSSDHGWFALTTDRAEADTLYRYRLADGLLVPDPASRYQPADVHGPSQVIDPDRYIWQNDDWVGRRWEDVVLYETHLGGYSREGSFDGMRRRLDHIARLGFTAIELMPIGDFEGRRNWGYDGVLPFAPDSAYGAPDDLKRLIDEAHGRGLMMFLDVVYNHFGPSGNYLGRYAPDFFTAQYHTPWGPALNFTLPVGRPVRDFFIHNALYWLQEYRFDGLRLDAVHAIRDDSQPDILEEIAATIRACIGSEREIHLVLENDNNAAHYLTRDGEGQPRCYVAQWNDDFHHAVHVATTGESYGYYADYAAAPVEAIARALAEGFVYQGEASIYRDGARRGEPSLHLPPTAFVSFVQNHDQIGNRPLGDRLSTLAEEGAVRALTAIVVLAPQIPMFFMGEEWGSERPFLFFCDFAGDLARAVREGREREFAHRRQRTGASDAVQIPDPNALDTFERSRLDWSESEQAKSQRHLELVRHLITLRHSAIVPRLAGMGGRSARHEVHNGRVLRVQWRLGDGARLTMIGNLSSRPAGDTGWEVAGERLYMSPADWLATRCVAWLPPWAVCFALEPTDADDGSKSP